MKPNTIFFTTSTVTTSVMADLSKPASSSTLKYLSASSGVKPTLSKSIAPHESLYISLMIVIVCWKECHNHLKVASPLSLFRCDHEHLCIKRHLQ